MSHNHVPGYHYCIGCGIWYPAGCETCTEQHVRLHHKKRRRIRKPRKESHDSPD